jgi:magnesium transporter
MRNLLVPELRELLAEGDPAKMNEFCQATHPAMIADFLNGLTASEIREFLPCTEAHTRAGIFSYLDIEHQLEMAEEMTRSELADIVSNMSHDERVDFIKRLPEDETEILMPAIAQAEREDIRRLASYPEGTAGAVMTSDYAHLSPDQTAAEAIDTLRREAPDAETIYYAYVLGDNRRLIGFVSLRDLIVAPSYKKVKDVMHSEMVFARLDEDQEEVARKIEKFDLLAIPVVNEEDALVGIVTHDDAFDILREEQTEDLEKIMGLTGAVPEEDYLSVPSVVHFQRRAMWIVALAALSFVSGYIFQSFAHTLGSMLILAFFMPMLVATGGNTGSQSATVVIRALALEQIGASDVLKVLWKELRISLMLSGVLIVVAMLRVFVLSPGGADAGGFSLVQVATVVGLALGLQVISSTLIGALLPLAAFKAKLDPAVVASPALTTMVDITGLLIYFGTAKLLLGV